VRAPYRRRVMSEHEKAAGQYPAACRAQNCVLSKWPRPPRLWETCIGRAKGANQNCCSVKGTNKLLRGGHYSSRFNFRFPQCVPLRTGLNPHTTCRLSALITPIRANFVGPPSVATKISASHCGIGSSKRRRHPLSRFDDARPSCRIRPLGARSLARGRAWRALYATVPMRAGSNIGRTSAPRWPQT
jgi:hypothetical protein